MIGRTRWRSRVEEDIQPAVDQRVDRVHPGHAHVACRLGGAQRPLREPAGREPVELGVEDHQGHQSKDVDRKRPADDAEDAGGVVDRLVLVHRRQDAQANADEHDRDDAQQRQLGGRRQVLQQGIRHGLVAAVGEAEVALHNPADPAGVLHRDGIIEAVQLDQGLDVRRPLRLIGEVERQALVGRHQRHHGEDQQRHAEQDDRKLEQASGDVGEHPSVSNEPAAPSRRGAVEGWPPPRR